MLNINNLYYDKGELRIKFLETNKTTNIKKL